MNRLPTYLDIFYKEVIGLFKQSWCSLECPDSSSEEVSVHLRNSQRSLYLGGLKKYLVIHLKISGVFLKFSVLTYRSLSNGAVNFISIFTCP